MEFGKNILYIPIATFNKRQVQEVLHWHIHEYSVRIYKEADHSAHAVICVLQRI
jgi:hypothetical protein